MGPFKGCFRSQPLKAIAPDWITAEYFVLSQPFPHRSAASVRRPLSPPRLPAPGAGRLGVLLRDGGKRLVNYWPAPLSPGALMAHEYDVFLSYNSKDRPAVSAIALALRARGLRPWLDKDELQPGIPWQDELKKAILNMRAAAVFVGDHGLGPWQRPEVRASLSQMIERQRPVIPVLLRGAPDKPDIDLFLAENTWVDLRQGLTEDGLAALVWGITGKKPGKRPIKAVAPAGLPVVTGPPKLPRHFQGRPEALARVVAALRGGAGERLSISGRGAVGIEGMGGIGKSVLAAAAAQEVAHDFQGGVFWVPVGRGADCLALLRALADSLGLEGSEIVSIPQGRDRLRRRLGGQRVLLVLDDVWTPEEVAALDVVDSPGRQLLTSRNAGLLASLGGEVVRINVLEPGAALALLAAWAGGDPFALPAAAHAVAKECGRLPLALALAGALARKVGRWEDVLDLLRQADLGRLTNEWLTDYPCRDLLRALAASVEALPAPSRERYLELAVFPEDAAIPEDAIATLWSAAGLDPALSRELLGELADWSLLRREDGRITLHDLQHDYVRHRTPDLPALQGRLVDAYRAQCPRGFANGPDDGWFFRRISWHLREAGREAELRALLFSFPFLLARLRQRDANGALQDLGLLPGEPVALALQTALRQAMHILVADPEQLAGQLLGRLSSGGDPNMDGLLREAEEWRGASWLRPLRLIPPLPRALLRTLIAGDNLRALAAFDGRRIATASEAGLELWDPETGERLRAQQEEASTLAVLDHRTVAYRDPAGRLGLWDVEANELTPLTVKTHRLLSLRAALSPLGIYLRVLRFAFRVLAPHRYQYLFFSEGLALAALGADLLALARPDASVQVVEIGGGRTKAILPGLLTLASSLQQLDERYLGSASTYGEIGVWDFRTGRLVRRHRLAVDWIMHSSDVHVAVLSGSPLLAATNRAGSLLVWNWQSGETLLEDPNSDYIRGLAWVDEHRLATLSQSCTLRIWDARSKRIVFELTHAQLGYPEALARAGGRLLVSAGRDGDVRVWDIPRLLETCEGEQGRPIPERAEGGKGLPENGPTLDESRVFPRYRGLINIVPLGEHRAAAATYDGKLQIWDTTTATLLTEFHPGLGDVPALCAIGSDRIALFRHQKLQLWSSDGLLEEHPVDVSYGTRIVALESGHFLVASVAGALVLLSPQGAVCEAYPLARGDRSHADSMRAVGDRVVYTDFGEPCLYFQDAGGASGTVPLDFVPGEITPFHGQWGVDIQEDKSSGQESGLALIDLSTGSVVRRWSRPPGLITTLVPLGPGRLASLATDHTVRVWDAERGRLLASFAFDVAPSTLAASPDRSQIFVGDREGRFHVFTWVEAEGEIDQGERQTVPAV